MNIGRELINALTEQNIDLFDEKDGSYKIIKTDRDITVEKIKNVSNLPTSTSISLERESTIDCIVAGLRKEVVHIRNTIHMAVDQGDDIKLENFAIASVKKSSLENFKKYIENESVKNKIDSLIHDIEELNKLKSVDLTLQLALKKGDFKLAYEAIKKGADSRLLENPPDANLTHEAIEILKFASHQTDASLHSDIPDYNKHKAERLSKKREELDSRSTKENEELSTSLFNLTTQHLYTELASEHTKAKDSKIVLTGQVLDDGMGDYQHMINAANLIKLQFPSVTIEVIPFFRELPKNLKKPETSKFETILCNSSKYPDDVLDKIKAAEVVIEVSYPLYSDKYRNIIDEKKSNQSYEFLGEYGRAYDSMGLKDTQLGVIFKEDLKGKPLHELKNKQLKQILFHKDQPTPEDVTTYFQDHKLYTAFLKAGSFYQMAFIYTVAALEGKTSSQSTVDICVPTLVLEAMDFQYLKNQGFGKVTVIKSGGAVTEKHLAKEGKELRLINPYPLEQDDFFAVLSSANPLGGCTGDNSLVEAIALNRLPFYELRDAKRDFWDSMIELAEQVGSPPNYYLKNYFQLLSGIFTREQESHIRACRGIEKWNGPEDKMDPDERAFEIEDLAQNMKKQQTRIIEFTARITAFMQSPEIMEKLLNEMSGLRNLLKENYNFNPLLKDVVGHRLVLDAYPEMKKFEKELFQHFMDKSISIQDAYAILKEKISSL